MRRRKTSLSRAALSIRCTAEELAAWRQLATIRGSSLSDIVRRHLDTELGNPHAQRAEAHEAGLPTRASKALTSTPYAQPVGLCVRCARIGQPTCEACRKTT